jgi:exopolyphosphatase/guanosine-5'-triphosphate,3'-diphosphate pyrophosphatase
VKSNSDSVLALDVGSRTLLWVEARRRGNEIVWGESGATTLELGRLLTEPDAGDMIILPALDAIKTLGQQFIGKVDATAGVLTGALRELPDVAEQLIAAGGSVGIELRVITAEEEGRLAWLGAADLFLNATGAVLDLGGHTAQLVVGEHGNAKLLGSLPIGCQTLTRQFFRHDPPTPNEIAQLHTYLDTMLGESVWTLDATMPLAIAGGTAAAWASLIASADNYRPDLIHGLVLGRMEGEELIGRLSSLPQNEIASLLKSDPRRAGVFLAGMIATVAVMKHIGRDKAAHTAHSVRHGLAKITLGIG